MQELPCYLVSGIYGVNNNHKCILIEGDTACGTPTKIEIKGYAVSTTTLIFYIFGIYNPTVANRYVGLNLKIHYSNKLLL